MEDVSKWDKEAGLAETYPIPSKAWALQASEIWAGRSETAFQESLKYPTDTVNTIKYLTASYHAANAARVWKRRSEE